MSQQRVALVTGSTSGIGWAIAQALAAEGCCVMLHGLGDPTENAARARSLAARHGVRVALHDADLRSPAAAAQLVYETEREFGHLDILVNNAGIQHVSSVEDFPLERWDAIQSVILHAPFQAVRAAVPGMKRRGWGRIINIASAHGLVASPFKSAYVSAKHGLVGFTRSVALELAEAGITSNAVCPGYVYTPLVEGQITAQCEVHRLPREQVIREVMLAAQPTKRFVEVDEVAAAVLFLCDEHARSITGATIAIDGGWTAR